MTPIFDCLDQHLIGPLGTILHVGAGTSMILDAYANLTYEHAVLVEGDSETFDELRLRAARVPSVQVVGSAVAPADGTATWHRCSLSSLNGLTHPEALANLYPRLRVLTSEPVRTRSIASLVNTYVTEGHSNHPNLLVLDAPGLEDSLLSVMPDDLLSRFSWVLVRRWPAFDSLDSAKPQSAADRLAAMNYRVVYSSADHQPAWQLTLAHFEVSPIQLQHLRATCHQQALRVDALLAEVEALIGERVSLHEACAAKEVEVQAAHAKLSAAVASHDVQVRQLVEDIERKSDLHAVLEQQVRDIRIASSNDAKRISELQERLDECLATREQAEILKQEQAARNNIYREEMLKAEAQLEMIKDLLLRGPRL